MTPSPRGTPIADLGRGWNAEGARLAAPSGGPHAMVLAKRARRGGSPRYPYGRHIVDRRELAAVLASFRSARLSGGPLTERFERAFSRVVGAKSACFVNSGSSANLLAAASLLERHREGGLRAGDEVLVPALSFPTTVNGFLLAGFRVALADTSPETLTVDLDRLERAIGPRTRAISLLHTLGNPCDLGALLPWARDRGLLVVEDACEALGTRWNGRPVGSFGAAGTFSFYPAHQITTGEGGCVVSAEPSLLPAFHSLRDWGRACPCGACARLAPASTAPELPADWDRHFVYTALGFNLKPLELQAAIGLVQLSRLEGFRVARKRNYERLAAWFAARDDLFALPKTPRGGDPCWFAFPVLLCEGGLERAPLLRFLATRGIETRPMLAGNLLRQPAYREVRFRVPGSLAGTERLLRQGFFFGLHPGLTPSDLDAMLRAFEAYLARIPRHAPATPVRPAASSRRRAAATQPADRRHVDPATRGRAQRRVDPGGPRAVVEEPGGSARKTIGRARRAPPPGGRSG